MVELHFFLCAGDDGHESIVGCTVVLPPQLVVTLITMEILRLCPMASSGRGRRGRERRGRGKQERRIREGEREGGREEI